MTLGQKLKKARLDRGLTQAQVVGDRITRNMLSQLENDLASPSVGTLEYLASVLGVQAAWLLADEKEEEAAGRTERLLALAAAQCALHALEAERFAAAQQLARQALSWNEASLYGHAQVRLEMLRVLARCAEQTAGDAEAAFAAYRAAYTELQPAVPYHLCMARYQLIQEHLPAAEHEIWSIADLPEASRAEYLILRGRLACKKEQYETAAEYLRQADALGPLPKLLERELCQSMELASRELQDYKTAYEYAARQLKL